MSIAKIVKCGEIAIEWHKALIEKAHAKHAYHLAWKRFETGIDDEEHLQYVHHEERISRHSPQFDEACAATQDEYERYRFAMDVARNVKRRLDNACKSALAKTHGGM